MFLLLMFKQYPHSQPHQFTVEPRQHSRCCASVIHCTMLLIYNDKLSLCTDHLKRFLQHSMVKSSGAQIWRHVSHTLSDDESLVQQSCTKPVPKRHNQSGKSQALHTANTQSAALRQNITEGIHKVKEMLNCKSWWQAIYLYSRTPATTSSPRSATGNQAQGTIATTPLHYLLPSVCSMSSQMTS